MSLETDNLKKRKKNTDDNFLFFESVRLVEALLFASAKPLDRASLKARIPENIDIDHVIEKIEKLYSTRGVNLYNIGDCVAFRKNRVGLCFSGRCCYLLAYFFYNF